MLQGEENSLSLFLYRPFSTGASQISAFLSHRKILIPNTGTGSSRCCWRRSKPPGQLKGVTSDMKTAQKLFTPPASQPSVLDLIPAQNPSLRNLSWSRFLVIQAENTRGRVTRPAPTCSHLSLLPLSSLCLQLLIETKGVLCPTSRILSLKNKELGGDPGPGIADL